MIDAELYRNDHMEGGTLLKFTLNYIKRDPSD